MRKKSILVILLVIVLAFATLSFSGCDIFSKIFGSNSGSNDTKIKLSTPKNLTVNETTITWSEVENADAYEIVFTKPDGKGSGYKVNGTTFNYGNNVYGEYSIQVRATSENDKYTSSDYCAEVNATLYYRLNVQESDVSHSVLYGELTVDVEPIEHATSYEISYKKGAGEWNTETFTTPTITLENYEKATSYYFRIKAKGEGYFISGDVLEYIVNAQADFSFAKDEEYDIASGSGFSFDVENAQRIKYDDIFLSADQVSVNQESIEISYDFLSDASLGEHQIAIFDESSVYCYILNIIDTRPPEFSYASSYVKDGEDFVIGLEIYNNQFSQLTKGGNTLSSAFYGYYYDHFTFYASYLDSLAEGTHSFGFEFIQNERKLTRMFSVVVEVKAAELNQNKYTFTGLNDLTVDISTHGDRVTSVKAGNDYLSSSDYESGKNSLIIYSSFLSGHSATDYVVNTQKTSLGFTVNYALNGFIPQSESYDYDKNTNADKPIEGVLHNNTFIVYGNGITTSDFGVNSSGQLTLAKAYLNGLNEGNYTFMVECEGVYSYFDVYVHDTGAVPQNVKFNFDIDTSVYVTFACDCGKDDHTYSIDGGAYKYCSRKQKLDSFSRTVDHTLTVKCLSNDTSSTYSYARVNDEGFSYMQKRITALGESQDKFVDSVEELAFVLKYLAYGGDGLTVDSSAPYGKSTVNVYVSDKFLDYIQDNDDYFKDALELSGATGVSCGLNGKGNEFTLTATFSSRPEAQDKAGTAKATLTDTRTFLSAGSRSSAFTGFAINDYTVTEEIMLESELDDLPLGVRPVFSSDSQAKSVYEAALNICRTYISDDMTDVEKLMTMYHWLATNITYDNNALLLFEVSANASSTNSVATFKSFLNSFIETYPALEDILSPLRNYSSMDEIRSYMQARLNSLRSFKLSGALLDNVAVCDGISSAFKLFCLIEGIPCVKVSGLGITASGSEAHAWDKVYLQGKWYIVDPTWARLNDTVSSRYFVNHAYFLIPEEDAIASHVENVSVYGQTALVDVVATGSYDVYSSEYMSITILGKSYDMRAESKSEFTSTVNAFKLTDEKILEFKLDFDYDSLSDLIKDANITCSYYPIDGGVLIILN